MKLALARRSRLFAAVLVCLLLLVLTWIRSAAQGGTIRYGDVLQASLTAEASDEWNLVAQSGDVIAVEVRSISGTFRPNVTILDDGQPFAGAISPTQSNQVNLAPILLPHEGSYVIRVAGQEQTSGEYQISLTLLSRAATTPTVAPTLAIGNIVGVIGYGQIVRGELGETVPRQSWRLNGNAGFVVDITMEALSGDLVSSLAILGPTGEVLAAGSSPDGTRNAGIFAFQLPFNGDYTILARVGEVRTAGTYTLSVTVRGSSPDPAASVLSFDVPIQGRLTPTYPRAVYRLGSTGRQALSIELSGIHRLINIRILTASGVVVQELQGLNPLLVPIQTDGSGPYFVELSALNYEESNNIDYRINAARLRSNMATPAAARFGETYTETLSNTQQYWIFNGREGDNVTLQVDPQQPSLEASMLLVDPQGVVNYEGVIGTGIRQSLILPRTGIYEVMIRPGDAAINAPGSVALTYSLRVSRTADVGYAARDRGELASAGVSGVLPARAADAYWIDAQSGQLIGIVGDAPDASANLGVLVQRPDGSTLVGSVSNRATQTVLPRITLDRSGRYRVIVFNTSDEALNYTLHYSVESGGVLQANKAVKAIMPPRSGTARWTFEVPAGALLNVRLTNLTPVSWSPQLYIITPSGLVLASAALEQNVANLLGVVAPITGSYVILVAGLPSEQHAAYRIEASFQEPFPSQVDSEIQIDTVSTDTPLPRYGNQPAGSVTSVVLPSLITRPVQFSALSDAPITQIQFGSTQAGEISVGALHQAFQFSALPNTAFTLKAETLEADAKPYLVLFDSAGRIVAEQFGNADGTASLTYWTQVGGRYTVVVSLGLREGRFLLSLRTPPITTSEIVVENGTPLQYGDKVEAEVTTSNAEARFFFSGGLRDLVSVTLERSTGTFNARIEILGANGQPIAQVDSGGSVVVLNRVELPATGLFSIRVQTLPGTTTMGGRYTLKLDLADPLRVRNRGGGILSSGDTAAGFLSRNDPEDSWLIFGQQGEEITLIAAGQDENAPMPLTLSLLDTKGQALAVETTSLAQGVLRLQAFTLTQTGLYRAVVQGGNTAGTYTISRLSARAAASVGIINYGQTINGLLTSQRRTDTWAFTGSVGDAISVSLRYVRGDRFLAGFQVFSENGLPLATGTPDIAVDGSARVNIVLPFSGTFSIFIANPQDDYTGAGVYALSLSLEDTKARSLGSQLHHGDFGYGDLYTDDPTDTWLFQARGGEQVRVIAAARDKFLHPQIELRGIGGNLVASASADQLAQLGDASSGVVMQSDGVYSLTITGVNGSTGAYSVGLEIVPPASAASTQLRYGDTRNGVIGDGRPSETYIFNGTQGDIVSMEVRRETGSSLDVGLELRSLDGRVLARSDAAGGDLASIASFRLPQTGGYQLVVLRYLEREGSTSGRYLVTLNGTPFVAAVRSAIEYGQVAIGRISNQLTEDRLRFSGSTGDVITIAAEATSGNLDLVVRLESATGEILSQSDDAVGVNPLIEAFQLPFDGDYILVVGRVGTSAGNYELLVNRVYQTQSTGAPAAGLPLVYGQRIVSSLDAKATTSTYSFTGSKDDVVVVRVLHQADDSPPTLNLRDAAGNILATAVSTSGQTVINDFRIPADGLYTLDLSRASNARSRFTPFALVIDLRSVTLPAAGGGVLERSGDVVGIFESGQTAHYWLLTGEASTRYTVQLQRLSGQYSPSLLIIAPNGQSLATASVLPNQPGVLISELNLPITGIYTIVVLPGESNGQQTSTNQYRLIVQRTSALPDEIGQIELGRAVDGTLSVGSATQQWSFTGIRGNAVTIQALTTAAGFMPRLLLVGPDGITLAEGVPTRLNDGEASVIARFTLPQDGQYTVIVQSSGGIGPYRLTLENGDVALDAAAAQQMFFDQPVTGVVRQGVEALWMLQAEAGDVLSLGVIPDDSSGAAVTVELRSIAGQVLLTSTVLPELPAVFLPATDRYLVAIRSTRTTTYTMIAQRRQELIATQGVGTRSITPNTPRVDTITDSNLVNFWRFEAQAGQLVQWTAERTSGDVRLDLTLFGPEGYIASSTMRPDSATVSLGALSIPQDGNYTLVVSRWLNTDGIGRGNYRVTLTLPDAATITPQPSASLVQLSYGQIVEDDIDEENPADQWLFSGSAGDLVDVVVNKTAGNLVPNIGITGSMGTVVGTTQTDENASIFSTVLPSTGNYQVTLAANEARFGSYQLVIEKRVESASVIPENLISYGDRWNSLLTSELTSQQLYFSGMTGDRVSIIVEAQTAVKPVVRLLDPQMRLIATSAFNKMAIKDVQLLSTGIYTIVVSADAVTQTSMPNAYSLHLLRNMPDTAYLGTLRFDTIQTAILTPDRPVHAWHFTARGGEVAAVRLQSPTPGFDPVIRIIGLDGTLLTSGGSAVEVLIPTDSEYICLVWNTNLLTAEYTLALSTAIAPTGGGRLYINSAIVTGNIEDADFTDQWRIEANSSTALTFEVELVEGNLQSELILYDPGGNILFLGTPDALPGGIMLPAAGTYTLLVTRVQGASGTTNGHYKLAIADS